jgi:hypothetical protein
MILLEASDVDLAFGAEQPGFDPVARDVVAAH